MDIVISLLVWLIGLFYMVIMFPLTLMIWLIVLPFDRQRSVIHWFLMLQSYFLVKLMPIWKTRIEGKRNAVKGTTYVIISNHQSLLDILLINCLRFRYKWISKIENIRIPFLGWYLRMAGYITINRGNEESKTEMMEKSLRCLNRGTSIMLFPEGTRSPDKEIGFFKRGAFQLALSAGVPILPILVEGTGGILPKHGLVFSRGNLITIRVLDPVLPASFGTDDVDELAGRFNSLLISEMKKLRLNPEIR